MALQPVASTIGRSHGKAAIHPSSASAAQAAGDLQGCRDGKDSQQGWNGNKGREQHLDELGCVPVLRVHQ
jgi:hypothetical protein